MNRMAEDWKRDQKNKRKANTNYNGYNETKIDKINTHNYKSSESKLYIHPIITIAAGILLAVSVIVISQWTFILSILGVANHTIEKVSENSKIDLEKNKLELERIRLFNEAKNLQLKKAEMEKQNEKEMKLHEDQRKIEEAINKEKAFKASYKPQPICNKTNIEWNKLVECKNEEIKKRKEFFGEN